MEEGVEGRQWWIQLRAGETPARCEQATAAPRARGSWEAGGRGDRAVGRRAEAGDV